LEEVVVIEESRPFLEPQITNILVNMPADVRPRVLGKRNGAGVEWMPSHGELTPVIIARVLHQWIGRVHRSDAMDGWISYLDQFADNLAQPRTNVIRSPYFCSGCPHNSSTKVPEGSQQLAGIGCHWLANLMDREVVTYPQMGGEGANWAGAAHFLKDEHIFANVGDGTWYHSGSLAIRQAVAAGVTMTYKILYNDAVAMTGGQPIDGPISVAQITHELRGEAVARTVVVSADPSRFDVSEFAAGTELYHRDDLGKVQRELREVKGVSVIIYEQTCATELRRRRGKGLAPEPARRVFINERVCEGCGDCSVQSNCLSVQPLETEFGRKRVIDQSACNKDFSCIKGFCPSFVTIEGGELARPAATAIADLGELNVPEPGIRPLDGVFGMMVTGIGGTGVVTISNLVGAAAQAEGLAIQALDLTGLAQKFGAVHCHLKIAADHGLLRSTRLSVGQCDVMIGADIVTSASDE
ncbi:MAG: indolepyruvate ferredoxin oxidoreductase, partial [Gammaproteobacteria bacterium HGW-Gammaproteobacteria-7]